MLQSSAVCIGIGIVQAENGQWWGTQIIRRDSNCKGTVAPSSSPVAVPTPEVVPPAAPAGLDIAGTYENLKYSGAKKNNWHYVTVTADNADKSVYTWKNRAGVSWKMTRDTTDPNTFNIGPDCPYYDYFKTSHNYMYTKSTLKTSTDGPNTSVEGIYGPWNELYTKM